MKILTIQQAYKLAVKKWEWIVAHEVDALGYGDIPELNFLKNYCSYCDMFLIQSTCDKKCPLAIPDAEGCYCEMSGHPYFTWRNSYTTESAQAVLDLIIKTKPEGVEP